MHRSRSERGKEVTERRKKALVGRLVFGKDKSEGIPFSRSVKDAGQKRMEKRRETDEGTRKSVSFSDTFLLFLSSVFLPFLFHMETSELLTILQYPSMRSAMLSAAASDAHVTVSGSPDPPATRSCSDELRDDTVWIDCTLLNEAIGVG